MSSKAITTAWCGMICSALAWVSTASAQTDVGDAESTASITGVPLAEVTAGTAYSFRPSAVLVGPAAAWFEVENAPPWASFDSFSGRLSGMPTEDDVGTHVGIRISLVWAASKVTLPEFSISVLSSYPPPPPPPLFGRSVSLSWLPPTLNADGSVLTDLSGYRVYVGDTPDGLWALTSIENPGITRYVIDAVPPGQHYFSVTALNSLGAESARSGVVFAHVLE